MRTRVKQNEINTVHRKKDQIKTKSRNLKTVYGTTNIAFQLFSLQGALDWGIRIKGQRTWRSRVHLFV